MSPEDPLQAEFDEAPLQAAAAQLAPLFYADLKRLARRLRHGVGRGSETLQTTALIHEAYLKLHTTPAGNDRRHFLRAAALAMRQVLVDDARARLTGRRNQGEATLPLEAAEQVAAEAPDDQVLAIDEALQRLAKFSPRLARTVECRYFAGYTEPEAAEALGVGIATVQRDWVKARAWLYRELSDSLGS